MPSTVCTTVCTASSPLFASGGFGSCPCSGRVPHMYSIDRYYVRATTFDAHQPHVHPCKRLSMCADSADHSQSRRSLMHGRLRYAQRAQSQWRSRRGWCAGAIRIAYSAMACSPDHHSNRPSLEAILARALQPAGLLILHRFFFATCSACSGYIGPRSGTSKPAVSRHQEAPTGPTEIYGKIPYRAV